MEIMLTLAGMGERLPEWLYDVLPPLNLTYRHEDEQAGYVPRLVDSRTNLILVDGDRPGWQFWTATPKSSPATRRVFIILVSEWDNVRFEALTAGADEAFSYGEMQQEFPAIVARLQAQPEKQIDCESPLPDLAVQGIQQFNAGEYYKQHDLFEALWMETEGPTRDLYRGILQVGVAYFQITKGNYRGAKKMLLRSVQWLDNLPDVCQGVDVRALREDAHQVRLMLEQMADDAVFDLAVLQPVKLQI